MNLLDISTKYLSLEPDKLLSANKVYEWAITQYEDSDEGGIEYIKENLSGRALEYALELLESQSSYMGTPVYFQNGKFSAPRLALYGYESRPLLKTKIREKIGKSNELTKKSKELRKSVKKEEVEISEKIDVGADAGATISDFVHSKSKTFKGDSKQERIKRALGAYYGAKNEEKNEEGKEKGADGKACWKGYKYAGTEKGKDKCVKEDNIEEAWYSGKGQYRTTASGNRVRWDEDDATDNRVSDMMQKKREEASKQAAKQRLAAKGNLPIKKAQEEYGVDENLELFVRYVLDKEIVESIEEVNELLATIDEENYQYIVSEAMAVAPQQNQQSRPQPNQQQKPQPNQQQSAQPVRPNPQQAQQNSPTPSAAPQPNRPQPNTPAPAGSQPQKPQPNQQQKKPGMTAEEVEELQTKKKDGVIINPKADEDMTSGEKVTPSPKKVASKLKEHFSLNVNKKSIINQFINIK
jgi:DNA segregation ATPase FtsK/SpoIIIE-like protein